MSHTRWYLRIERLKPATLRFRLSEDSADSGPQPSFDGGTDNIMALGNLLRALKPYRFARLEVGAEGSPRIEPADFAEGENVENRIEDGITRLRQGPVRYIVVGGDWVRWGARAEILNSANQR